MSKTRLPPAALCPGRLGTKKSRPRAATLLSFSAFMLLSLCGSAAAQKGKPTPTPTPTPALTEVTHDASLAGKGTAAEPLGINTTGATAGQVLTATGSGVEWRTPAAGSGGLRVLDAADVEVGVLNGAVVVRLLPGSATTLIALGVSKGGVSGGSVFPTGSGNGTNFFYYTTPNCDEDGPAQVYLDKPALSSVFSQGFDQLIVPTLSSGDGKIYYPTGPTGFVEIFSRKDFANGLCQPPDGQLSVLTPVGSFLPTDLGLTPPFRVVK